MSKEARDGEGNTSALYEASPEVVQTQKSRKTAEVGISSLAKLARRGISCTHMRSG